MAVSGSHAYLLDRHGLSREAIVAAVKSGAPHAEARRFMTGSLVSIVLPVHNQADHVVEVVREYEEGLSGFPFPTRSCSWSTARPTRLSRCAARWKA